METNKILSFEEFSTKGTETATAEAPTTDTATVDVATTDADAARDTDREDVRDEETTDTEETTDAEETEETEDETTDEAEEMDGDSKETMTVAEMYEKACEAMQHEAAAYEADEYEDHTKGTYMKNTATLAAEGHCKAVEEMYEGKCTKEQFEAHCNEMKTAYEKKCNEAMEAYGTDESERPENAPMQGPSDAIIVKPEQ